MIARRTSQLSFYTDASSTAAAYMITHIQDGAEMILMYGCWINKNGSSRTIMRARTTADFAEKVKLLPVQSIPRILIQVNNKFYRILRDYMDTTSSEQQEGNKQLLLQLEDRINILAELMERKSCKNYSTE